MKKVTKVLLIIIILMAVSVVGYFVYLKYFKKELPESNEPTYSIVGKYIYNKDGYYQELMFNEDGTYWLYAKKSDDGASYGNYTLEENTVTLNEKYSFSDNACLGLEYMSVFLYSFENGKIITDDSYVGMTETKSIEMEKTNESLNKIEKYIDLFNTGLCKSNGN